jgi:GDP-D-mannose 3',5'-epimerase
MAERPDQYTHDRVGVPGGRNSDHTFIQQVLGWEPSTPLKDGLRMTYAWITKQYQDREAGKRTIS